jgi:hypothetical protein
MKFMLVGGGITFKQFPHKYIESIQTSKLGGGGVVKTDTNAFLSLQLHFLLNTYYYFPPALESYPVWKFVSLIKWPITFLPSPEFLRIFGIKVLIRNFSLK